MVNKYGLDGYGEGVYSEYLDPLVDERIIDYFPEVLPRETDSVFYQYLDENDSEMEDYGEDLDYLKKSHQIGHAREEDLEEVGKMYGELGRRRGRSDREFREHLKSIAPSFRGRGTKPGMRMAIASGIDTDVENVTIIEDFENNEYEIRLDTDTVFRSRTINDMAELSEPSGVEISSPPVIVTDGDSISHTTEGSSVIDSSSGIGSGALTFDGNSTIS